MVLFYFEVQPDRRNSKKICSDFGEQVEVTISNPFRLKIRPEKQIAEVLGLESFMFGMVIL